MSSTISYKYSTTPNKKEYYHVTCKNKNCKSKGLHYNADKIEEKLIRILDELVRYMYTSDNEILVSSYTKNKDIETIDKAINNLQIQEKKLVDLYLNSSLNVETINLKNENIKKEIIKLIKKKETLFPDDINKEYTLNLLQKLNIEQEKTQIILKNSFAFSYMFSSLNRKSEKELINKCISNIEITRDKRLNIDITNIKFTDEFIRRNTSEHIDYLNNILIDNQQGIVYIEAITDNKLNELSKTNYIFSLDKYIKNKLTTKELTKYEKLIIDKFYDGGISISPYMEDNILVDYLVIIPKK